MNDYEILLLLDPELAEERANEIIARIRERVEGDGGTWDGHEPWGRRRLAYEIGHKAEGIYHLLLFTTTAPSLDEITRVLKITDGVIRHGAYRRVKGGSTKAPPAPPPVAAAPSVAAQPVAAQPVAAQPVAAQPVAAPPVAAASAPADDAGGTAE